MMRMLQTRKPEAIRRAAARIETAQPTHRRPPTVRPQTAAAAAAPRDLVHSASRPVPVLQTKRVTNRPGDAFELQADRIADQVMRAGANRLPGDRTAAKAHRDQAHEHLLTRSTQAGAAGEITAPAVVESVLNSPGHPLDTGARAFLEPRFQSDFSHIQVHTGAEAEQSAHAINALAYTSGNHLVFAAGQYSPATPSGRHLLAHELTHSLQQGSTDTPTLQRKDAGEATKTAPKDEHCWNVFTQRWGCDTVCSRAGFYDNDTPFIAAGGEHGMTGCCNKWPPFVESYARSDLGLNGAASCKGAMYLGIYKVRHGDQEIRIACTDSTTSDSDHSLELSPKAASDLFGSVEFPKNTLVKVCPDGHLGSVCQLEPGALNGPHRSGQVPSQKSCVAKGCYPQDPDYDCARVGWPRV